MQLRIISYNMLKGRSLIRKREIHKEMAIELNKLKPDLLILQEFPDACIRPGEGEAGLNVFNSHHLTHAAYGFNARTKRGRHGNALLSHFPIVQSENIDISSTKMAHRGVVHCQLKLPGFKNTLHVFCTHLDLFQSARNKQVSILSDLIQSRVDKKEVIVFSGDFNDWNVKLDEIIYKEMEDRNLPLNSDFGPIKTFPSPLPILPLDRIYVRNQNLNHLWTPRNKVWRQLSDHRPIIADCTL